MRVAVVAVALCLAPSLAAPQSLGDAARRQARKRPTQAPATRVYTDTDLRSSTDAPEQTPAEPFVAEGLPGAGTVPAAAVPGRTADDPLRAQLDREAGQRKQQELFWRQLASVALARLAASQREHDAVCGPGVLLLTGG